MNATERACLRQPGDITDQPGAQRLRIGLALLILALSTPFSFSVIGIQFEPSGPQVSPEYTP